MDKITVINSPTSSENEYEENVNNGLISKIWGPHLWEALHSITYGYPVKPSEEQKKNYMAFFILVGQVMPCKYCRESYQEFIKEDGLKLTPDIMSNRRTLTEWLYKLHNRVNKKLEVEYGVTLNDIDRKYESYRAKCIKGEVSGCIMPLHSKAKCYKYAYYKDYPIIPLEVVELFMDYSKKRGVPESEYHFYNEYKNKPAVTNDNKKINSELWCQRNKECEEITWKMRMSAIPCLEEDGIYKGLPTYEELRMIIRVSSSLSVNKLREVSELLKTTLAQVGGNYKKTKIYKLVR